MGIFDKFKNVFKKKNEALNGQPKVEQFNSFDKAYFNAKIEPQENGRIIIRDSNPERSKYISEVQRIDFRYDYQNDKYNLNIHTKNSNYEVFNADIGDFVNKKMNYPIFKDFQKTVNMNRREVIPEQSLLDRMNEENSKNKGPYKLENASIEKSKDGRIQLNVYGDKFLVLPVENLNLAYNKKTDQYHLNIQSNGKEFQVRNINKSDIGKIDNSIKNSEEIKKLYNSNEHQKKIDSLKTIEKSGPGLSVSNGMSL